MKKLVLSMMLLAPAFMVAKDVKITSPNEKLVVTVNDDGGKLTYSATYEGKQVVLSSALGFKSNIADFTKDLNILNDNSGQKAKTMKYSLRQTKATDIVANGSSAIISVENKKEQRMDVEFFVKDNDIAFRYLIPEQKRSHAKCIVIESETTSFLLPDGTTTFICPQIHPGTGFERTKPSYEEEYVPDDAMNKPSRFHQGYTFPCLFKETIDNAPYWVLISETGVTGEYCGSHISDFKAGQGYAIAFPQQGENNGFGSTTASFSLPGNTPWRTITIGSSLKPIVETTIPYDVVNPLYKPTEDYKAGRYTWSWLIWQDNSMNWNDQIKFIDLAAEMGYEYILVDALWDTQVGRDRMPALAKYAQSKGVSLLLWYNSNGKWNDAPQGPRNCMDNSIARDREMAWMKSLGVKGIKVDFFGGDKQETMKLYEDILFDANRYGIQVIFHGCTLPRGWEKMYPNFVSSEAVLASENVFFSEHHAKQEGFELTMHPFCRNAVASMDWGGVIMNKFLSRDNKSRHKRYTTDAFEIATAFTNQAAVQCVAIQPNNLNELPQQEIDFLKQLPTTWEETRFIDGYPGKYVVMARRHGDKWYVAGLNATKEPMQLTIDTKELGLTQQLTDQVDKKTKEVKNAEILPLKPNKKGLVKFTMQPNGGIVMF